MMSPRSRSALWYGALLAPLPFVATGCIGCSDAEVICDETGCYACDAFGCTPVDPPTTSGNQGGNGQGGDGPGDGGEDAQGGGTTSQGGSGAGGSPPVCDPEIVTCPCDAGGECPDELSCIDGACLVGCNFDYECGPDHVCAEGQCVAECDAVVLCETGYVCVGGGCLVDPNNPQCDGPEDCAGLRCVGGLCTTLCDTNDDCPEGELCNSETGACFEDASPVPLCGPNQTCPGVGQTCMPDGYCRYECDDLIECKLIDARFDQCHMGVCKTDEELDPECDLSTPCDANEVCVSNECVPAP